jgi:hypothetical protein
MTFVFREIPFPVRLVQYAPLLAREIDRVLQTLKHDVAAIGSITVRSQRGERECVGRVVRKVESAFDAESSISRILESRQTGANEPGNFISGSRLFL